MANVVKSVTHRRRRLGIVGIIVRVLVFALAIAITTICIAATRLNRWVATRRFGNFPSKSDKALR